MKQFILAAAAATALLTTAATAAPLGVQGIGAQTSDVEQVRMVCDEYGRCYRSRGPRYVQRSYGYGDGYRGYDDGPRYERRGYYGGGGPSIGFSFGGGGGRW
jgi:hypothetical protein